jgi:uncharacterized membrane protein YkvA (DUF1232 family)
VLAVLVAYLAMPFDLVPDMIPVIGLLDDAVLAGLVLRSVVNAAGENVVRELWPGPPESLEALLKVAFPKGR